MGLGTNTCPGVPLSSACLARCTGVQLEATPSTSSDSSRIRSSVRWGIELGNILQVVSDRKLGKQLFISISSLNLPCYNSSLPLSVCTAVKRLAPSSLSSHRVFPGMDHPCPSSSVQGAPALTTLGPLPDSLNVYIQKMLYNSYKKSLICISLFLYSHREIVPCGPYWKILSGHYILNPSMQTSKSKARKGQNHPVNTLTCTSLTLLPITARLSLKAQSCHGT